VKTNEELKAKYDEMHKQGPSAWFSDGTEEREMILNMGRPWESRYILEIGCGEGDLAALMAKQAAYVYACDYSEEAIKKARKKYPKVLFRVMDFHENPRRYDRVVMQGVLEHLDDPWGELRWIINNLLSPGGDIITSSPCFLNPRGLIWMTLHMLGAVMSRTDRRFLHPSQFRDFCIDQGYHFSMMDCDYSWGNENIMVDDFSQRIPLALKDGGIPVDNNELENFLHWVYYDYLKSGSKGNFGATMVYHIKT